MSPKPAPKSSKKPKLGWNDYIIVSTSPSSTIAEDGLNESSALQIVASARPSGSFSLPMNGGYFSGTWTYHPQDPESTPAIAAAEAEKPTEESESKEADADKDATEPTMLRPGETGLKAVCRVCDEDKDDLQMVYECGWICAGCVKSNVRRT